MVLNVKPQTLVETFDQANYNSFPDRGGGGGGSGVGEEVTLLFFSYVS